jgi:NAD(P)-dependent dehydrogenase (short-subunit alcohol dehydrogenase family)
MARYPEIEGKTALVTGAGRSIGRAIAMRLAREGAQVAVADIDRDGAESVAAEIRTAGGEAVGLHADVTCSGDVDAMIAGTVEAFGKLDILVANAGIGIVARLIDTDEASWDRLMAVNAKGVFLCCTAAGRQMIRQGHGGRIVINASGAGKIAPGKNTPLGAYAASKHAAIGFGKQLGLELSDHQILVNSICGGIIDTPMWDLIDRETARILDVPEGSIKAGAVGSIPLGRIQQPEDMANVVAFLCSDDAGYITSSAMNVEGGLLPY